MPGPSPSFSFFFLLMLFIGEGVLAVARNQKLIPKTGLSEQVCGKYFLQRNRDFKAVPFVSVTCSVKLLKEEAVSLDGCEEQGLLYFMIW